MRQHVKGLEHKTHMGTAPDGQTGFVQPADVLPLVQHLALVPAVQPGQAVEQRGLAHARITDDGDKLARRHLQVDLLEHRGRIGPVP
jgi:hypothetical protein